MKTYKRICLKDHTVTDGTNSFTLKRGKEYMTSEVNCAPAIGPPAVEGHVIVMSEFWVAVPADIFGGEVLFTPGDLKGGNKCQD